MVAGCYCYFDLWDRTIKKIFSEEIVKEEYSEFRYEDDMPEVDRTTSRIFLKTAVVFINLE